MRLRSRPSRVVTAVAVALGAVLLASCGAVGQNTRGVADDTSRVRVLNPYGGDLAAEGTPKTGGNLIIGNDREIVSFDPTRQNGNVAAQAIYDLLLRIGPDGKVQPWMAQSIDTADDGLTWRLGLREGVQFSDGTDLNADAVIINVQRHIDKATSPAHAYADKIASMRAVDPLTVEFTLKAPLGDFPVYFAQAFNAGSLGMIVSPAALAQYGDDIANNPVGAGPFVMDSWIRDNRMVLRKNPNYWQQGKPYLDTIEFRPLPDTETRYSTMQNGDVDMIFGGYNNELVRAFANPDLTTYYGPGNGGFFFYFNFQQKPFDDRRMREAVVRAIDLNALGASQYMGQLIGANGLFEQSSSYHNPEAEAAWPQYDPEKARQLVQEYVTSGGSATLAFSTSRSEVSLGEFVQAQLAAVGITVELRFYDLAEFTSRVIQSGDFNLISWVNTFDYPYPGAARLLRSDGNVNYGKYANPEVDRLLDEAGATTDEAVRTRAYQQVELLTNQDVAVAWLSRSYLSTITKPEVKGVDRYLSRDLFYSSLWLDR
jgi:ABC-type transport system substrate-binding protein